MNIFLTYRAQEAKQHILNKALSGLVNPQDHNTLVRAGSVLKHVRKVQIQGDQYSIVGPRERPDRSVIRPGQSVFPDIQDVMASLTKRFNERPRQILIRQDSHLGGFPWNAHDLFLGQQGAILQGRLDVLLREERVGVEYTVNSLSRRHHLKNEMNRHPRAPYAHFAVANLGIYRYPL